MRDDTKPTNEDGPGDPGYAGASAWGEPNPELDAWFLGLFARAGAAIWRGLRAGWHRLTH